MKPLEDNKRHRVIYDKVGKENKTLMEEKFSAMKAVREDKKQYKEIKYHDFKAEKQKNKPDKFTFALNP